jgi:hypothetical protein
MIEHRGGTQMRLSPIPFFARDLSYLQYFWVENPSTLHVTATGTLMGAPKAANSWTRGRIILMATTPQTNMRTHGAGPHSPA